MANLNYAPTYENCKAAYQRMYSDPPDPLHHEYIAYVTKGCPKIILDHDGKGSPGSGTAPGSKPNSYIPPSGGSNNPPSPVPPITPPASSKSTYLFIGLIVAGGIGLYFLYFRR